MRALAGEDEHGFAGQPGTGDHRRTRPAVGQLAQSGQQVVAVSSQHHRATLERGATCQRPTDVCGPQFVTHADESGQPRGLRLQCGRRLGRHHPRNDRRRCCRAFDGRLDRRDRFDDDVRVGATDAERRHPRPTRPTVCRPRLLIGQQLHGAHRPIHMWAGRIHVQRRRQHLVAHRQDHLHHTRDACGGLGVAHVRFDRPQPQWRLPVLPVGRQNRLGFNRIAQRGARAVAFDHLDVRPGQSRAGQCRADHSLLGRTVGCGQPIGRAVLVDRRTAYDRQDRVPQASRVGKPLHHQHPAALGETGAVGGTRERFAAPVGGQPAHAAEFHEDVGCGVDGDATGQRQIALPRPQRLSGHVQRDQRRRARGIHRHRRALQPQDVRHPSGRHTRRLSGEPEALRSLRGTHAVALGIDPGEHAGGAASQHGRVNTGPLQRFPGQLEEHPLLGVHRQRF